MISFNDEHPEKQCFPIDETESGIMMSVKEEHPSNEPSQRDATD